MSGETADFGGSGATTAEEKKFDAGDNGDGTPGQTPVGSAPGHGGGAEKLDGEGPAETALAIALPVSVVRCGWVIPVPRAAQRDGRGLSVADPELKPSGGEPWPRNPERMRGRKPDDESDECVDGRCLASNGCKTVQLNFRGYCQYQS